MCVKLVDLSHVLAAPPSDKAVAYHAGQTFSLTQFQAAVGYWADQFKLQSDQRYALYTEDAYPFAVLLFALLHAGKEVWIPGNNQTGTAQQLEENCRLVGDWQSLPAFAYEITTSTHIAYPLAPLNADRCKLVIFTSGSTGLAKAIPKTLQHLQTEISTLENLWGKQLAQSEVLATVSHQHIYGLLFRVLWPIYAGRCFHSEIYLNPELLCHAAANKAACWVASPAHLKRLVADSPWLQIAQLSALFSSGGVLSEIAALQIKHASGLSVLEVYGSSETGGIAWRQGEQAWQLFSGMKITENSASYYLYSPYLPAHPDGFKLDDQLTLLADHRFLLQGRADRIVKIEEKRVSLIELEQRLLTSPMLEEVVAFTSHKNRDTIAVALVLTASGKQMLAASGRKALIQHLKAQLAPWFENIVLPRKWLITNAIPLTKLGKIQHNVLTGLIDSDHQRLPHVLQLTSTEHEVQLELKVPNGLIYFPDHFAGFSVLPGVVQLAWVSYFGQLLFGSEPNFQPLSQLELIKFSQIIKPDDELTLTLNWKAEQGKLQFKFNSAAGVFSSGRMAMLLNESIL